MTPPRSPRRAPPRAKRSLPDPPLLFITDRHAARAPLISVVAEALAGGARWILVREKDLPDAEFTLLLATIQALAAPFGALVATSGRRELAAPLGIRAIHLPTSETGFPRRGPEDVWEGARIDDVHGTRAEVVAKSDVGGPYVPVSPLADDELWPATEAVAAARSALGANALVGCSCHAPRDVRIAAAAGADYATLSIIYPTTGKDHHGPLQGIEGLARVCRSTSMPVLALGGVRPDRVAACRGAGAAGVAVLGAVQRAERPADATRALIAAWHADAGGRGSDG